jgi:hypothetical protein
MKMTSHAKQLIPTGFSQPVVTLSKYGEEVLNFPKSLRDMKNPFT